MKIKINENKHDFWKNIHKNIKIHENIYRIMAIIKLVEHLEYVEATFPFIYFYHLGPKNIYFIIETLRNDHGTFCIVYTDQDFTTLMFTLFVD